MYSWLHVAFFCVEMLQDENEYSQNTLRTLGEESQNLCMDAATERWGNVTLVVALAPDIGPVLACPACRHRMERMQEQCC